MKKRVSDNSITIFAYVFLGVFALLCLYPMLLVLAVSFSDENTVVIQGFKLMPVKLSLDSYQYLFDSIGKKLIKAYAMTILNTAIGTLSALFITAMMSFTASQKYIKYRNVISMYAYFAAIFSAGMVPWYVVCVSIYHIKNTIFALFLPYVVNVFLMFVLRNYFSSIPNAIGEAAKMDGANDFTIFIKLIVPLSKTAILTIGFLYALQFWNDWWLPLMLISDNDYYTMQYYLYTLLSSAQAIASGEKVGAVVRMKIPAQTIKMAVTMVTIGPMIMLYPFVQKYFVKGIIIGAVKG